MDSERIIRVLELIAEGRSYEQIIAVCPDLTYTDIFAAAAEALKVYDDTVRATSDRRSDCPGAPARRREDTEPLLRTLRRSIFCESGWMK